MRLCNVRGKRCEWWPLSERGWSSKWLVTEANIHVKVDIKGFKAVLIMDWYLSTYLGISSYIPHSF
jgi:hypothetical protein